ncbi:MAG: ABC transporter ATP-binding protein [Desulfomonilaceae bacterium]
MDEPLLKLEKVDVSYRDVQVLHGIDIDIYPSEIITVIGPNGAGKSTLLNAIMGFEAPSAGTLTFKGNNITGTPPEDTVKLGMTIVPEGARVFTEMTVLDNLKMGSYTKASRASRKESLELVFNFFPLLHERMNQKGGTLSGGERQMLAIGRALMSRPSLLLLDEPSLGLAPLLVVKVFETIIKISATGLTVLLVEQNVYYSLEISQRAYVLENGKIVNHGFSGDLMRNDHIKRSYLAI